MITFREFLNEQLNTKVYRDYFTKILSKIIEGKNLIVNREESTSGKRTESLIIIDKDNFVMYIKPERSVEVFFTEKSKDFAFLQDLRMSDYARGASLYQGMSKEIKPFSLPDIKLFDETISRDGFKYINNKLVNNHYEYISDVVNKYLK